jgi:hypothetical protein
MSESSKDGIDTPESKVKMDGDEARSTTPSIVTEPVFRYVYSLLSLKKQCKNIVFSRVSFFNIDFRNLTHFMNYKYYYSKTQKNAICKST